MYRLLRKYYLILALVTLPGSLFSQATITGAEYFWDTDPGQGNATAMVALDGSFDEAIETALESALAAPPQGGLHLFCVRFQDSDGDWGPIFKRTIATENAPRDIKITLAEYFWDTDPGEGSGTAMVAFDGTFDEAIETVLKNPLTTPAQGGLHLFNIRVSDEDGNWGPVFKRTIAVEDAPRDIKVTLAEYFWDADPGEGSGTAMVAFDGAFDEAVETVLQNSLTTPAQGGLHLFNVRVCDEDGNWGPVFKRTIATEAAPRDIKITMAEYFWDTDPGEGSGTAMVAFDGVFDEAIETALKSNLTTPAQGGLHLFNVRVRDDQNNWGPVFKRTIATEDSPRDIKIQAAEFFWNTDPGEGSGTAMVAFDGAFDEAIETALESALTMPAQGGLNLFNVRVQDDQGNWGPVFKRTVFTEAAPRDIKITAAEYFWGLTDPGEGNGTAMVAFDGAFDEAIETALANGLNSPGIGLALYNVRVQDENGNWGPLFKRTVYIEIPGEFLEVVALNPTDSICYGDSVQLVASGLVNYSWDPAGSLSGATGDTVWASPTTTTTYVVTADDGAGTTEVDSITITVIPLPVASVSGLDSIYCTTASPVTMTGNPTGGAFSGTGVTGNTFDPAVAGLGTHEITYSVANAFGCTDDTTITVTVNDLSSSSTINPVACDSYLSPEGNTYTVTGAYIDVIPNAVGCDSTITINLTVNQSTTSSISESTCDSYTAPSGAVYTTTGIYSDTIPNAVGCDSVITINLTILNATSITLNEVACEGYTLNAQTYTSSGTYTQMLTNAGGCDSLITLNLVINNNTTSTITESACDTYTAPSGAVYTSSGTYTDVISTATGCDSTITINLTITTAPTNNMIVSECDSYTLNGQTYTSSGTFTQTLTAGAANGCDSIIVLNLIINNATSSTLTESACNSYTAPSGTVYTASGIYTDVIPNAAGCDSVITINLTITNGGFNVITDAACDLYTLNAQTYTTSGTYTQTLVGASANGCDSTIVLNLIINNSSSSTLTEIACDSYTAPSGAVYTSSGTFTDIIPNAAGCDSTITIDLTINNNATNTITDIACDSYTANGQTYTLSGTYVQTLPGSAANGCDSVVTLNLIINKSTSSTLNETVCGSYTLNGQTYSASGTYFQQLPNAVGCDSTITLNLTVNQNGTNVITDVACDSYTLNAQTYTSSGTYTQTLPGVAANGCDSVITLNLIINYSNTGVDVVSTCDSYTWIDGNTYTANNNTATWTLTNAAGCDSVVTLNLTINQSSTSSITEVVCDSYTAPNGTVYTASGTYVDVIPNVAGCDSTITITLTVNNSESVILTEVSCDSYTLNGFIYTSSGIYTQSLTTVSGCDSIITLNLTINNATTSNLTEVTCDSYTAPSGAVYSTSGTYTDIIPNAAGCDSVITIDLTINSVSVNNMTEVACGSYTLNGQTYTSSGTYTQTLVGAGANGCDSVIVLNLLINTPTSSTITETTCGTYTAPSGAVYTSSGTYTDIIPNAAGCDSVITINLTINNTAINNLAVAECDNYTLNGQTYISSGTYNQVLAGATANGCDSMIVLNLIINNSTTSTISPVTCDSYTSPSGTVYATSGTYTDVILNAAGCDSVITINLTINGSSVNNLAASACDSYTLNGQTYTSTGLYTQNLPGAAANGCDSTILLNLTVTGSVSASITETVCDSYTINGTTYTTSGTYVETFVGGSVNGCDSVVTVVLTILNSTYNTITDVACDTYTLNGQTYTSSGSYTQTLTNVAGCDSIITLVLTINYTSGITITEATCNNYTLNGQTYTASGTYTQLLTNAAGCDSIITLNLTIGTFATTSTINDVACDTYTAPSGAVFATSGSYTDVIPNVSGCDSIITINLTVNNSTASILNEFSCGGYTLNGQTYTSTGTYVQIVPNANGCDSTITLNLTVGSPSTAALTLEECDSYTLNGQTYTSTGIYTQMLTNAAGCDSTITLNLTINNTLNVLNEMVCGSYTLNGQTYASTGTYTQVLPVAGVNGCDSTIMINLTVIPIDNILIDTASCNSFTMNGQTYTSSGTYVQNLTNSYGCDSIVTLNLTIGTINSFSTISEVACDSYTAPSGTVYASSGTYVDVIPNVSGCDSIITINLTINNSTASTIVIDDCNSYTLNGQTYTATGIYTQVLTNSVGCDSTITLDLTINASGSTINASSCNSYSLNGQTYTSTGVYTQTLVNAAGCDSVITLNLTIGTQSSSSTITEIACDSYISPSGVLYTTSGTYTDIITNAVGCDSVITINLTVNSSSVSTLNETVCDGYMLNGVTYVNTGTYTQTLTNAAGCDSTITLNLTVNANGSLLSVASCNSFTLNGLTYTSSGTYTQVLTNAAGCDSTITLGLVIGTQASSSTITEVACDSYTTPSGVDLTSSGVYVDTIPNAVGCDSVITIILTVNYATSSTDVVAECDSYTWIDGNTYTSSNNTATFVTANAVGCDSTVYLDLTINNSTSSTITETALDSYTLNGQTYTQSGTYTQVLTNAAGCDSTITLDLSLDYTGLEEHDEIWVSLYPNPSYGQITIQGLESVKDVESIYMTDARGRLVRVFEPNTSVFDITDVVIGMYHIHIKHPEGIETLKVMKQ